MQSERGDLGSLAEAKKLDQTVWDVIWRARHDSPAASRSWKLVAREECRIRQDHRDRFD
jgi:hypothetical protein